MSRAAGWALAVATLLAALPAGAQLAPSAAEAAAYDRLHAAAWRGDLGDLQQQLAAACSRS